jgi:hypothetical protein
MSQGKVSSQVWEIKKEEDCHPLTFSKPWPQCPEDLPLGPTSMGSLRSLHSKWENNRNRNHSEE